MMNNSELTQGSQNLGAYYVRDSQSVAMGGSDIIMVVALIGATTLLVSKADNLLNTTKLLGFLSFAYLIAKLLLPYLEKRRQQNLYPGGTGIAPAMIGASLLGS